MVGKMLFKHLQTLTHTSTRHRFATSTLKSQPLLHHRLYTAAAPPPLPTEIDFEKPGNAKKVVNKSGSIIEAEVTKFDEVAHQWWDTARGPHKGLHAMNPMRLAFLRSTLCRHFGRDPSSARPFEGLNIVDVGCGGGILSEPLARLGANVTGVDAAKKNIEVACHHAGLDPTTSSIEYLCTTAENLVEEKRQFDAVVSLEVVEHVADPAEFCKSLSALTVPGGAIVISTPNRTMRSYAVAIVGAEYLFRMLPVGTHEWSKFVTPEELVLILQQASISVKEIAGIENDPLTGRWLLSEDVGINYITYGSKNSEANTDEDPAF